MTLTATTQEQTTRTLHAITDAIDQLTKPRLIHTTLTSDEGGVTGLHTEQHPALIDLLEQSGAIQRGTGRGGTPNTRIPIDAEALEIWAQIRDQVRAWLRELDAIWVDDLKTDLEKWLLHHENAVIRGRIPTDKHHLILRTIETWVDRIDKKFDPDDRLEFTDPCPATIRNEAGDLHRCAARKVQDEHGDLIPAIEVNISRRTAHCRACGTRWTGERDLMQLRYAANLANAEGAE